jgi:hypothetical protein
VLGERASGQGEVAGEVGWGSVMRTNAVVVVGRVKTNEVCVCGRRKTSGSRAGWKNVATV